MQNFHIFHTCSVNNNAPGIKFVLAVVLKIDRKIIHYYINFFIYCVFKLHEILSYTDM